MKLTGAPPCSSLLNFKNKSYKIKGYLILFFLTIGYHFNIGYAATTNLDNLQSVVTGTITDETGMPLPGASVVEKGTTNGTQTDFDGNYSIELSQTSATLLVSYIGYEAQEIALNSNQTVYNISLNPSLAALDEVVVVGYGTQRKREITGSIASISADAITEQTVTGFDQAMAGRVAGVQISQSSGAPGGSTNIRVRGIGTPGSSEPLYVIDGIPVYNNNAGRQAGTQPGNVLNTINPNDIQSVEILKDAASGAIYGSRAGNGVVIITTKKGIEGPLKLNLDYSIGMQSKEKTLDVLDGPTYTQFRTELEGSNPNFTNPANTNWQDEIFQSAPVQNINLNASGGSESSKYSVSLGYLDQQGIIRNTDFQRLSLRINTSHKLGERFRIGNNTLISRAVNNQIQENDVFNAPIGLSLIYPSVIPARNPDGSLGQPGDVGTSFIRSGGPLFQTDSRSFESEQFRFLGNVYAEYDLLDDLTYRINLGGDFLFGGSNSFTPFFEGNGTPNTLSTGQRFDSTEWIWLVEHTLNYSKTFNDIHNINLLAGFSQQKSSYSNQLSTGNNFVSNDLISIGTAQDRTVETALSDWSLMSYFGRLNYNLKDKYFLSATIRRDGSSRFGPGNKWGVFPSVSAGWLVSDEEFFNLDFVDVFKLRGSWGQLGNQEIAPFQYLPLLNLEGRYTFGGNIVSGAFAPQPANENVTWETIEQTNIGVDLAFLSQKVTFSVDYFDKKTIDILLPGTLPLSYGFISNGVSQFPTINAGTVRNTGVEFDLGIRGYKEDFSWSFNANLATLNNNVESVDPGGPIIVVNESFSTRFDVGLPIGAFYGFKVDGIIQNQAELEALNSGSPTGIYQNSGTAPGDFRFKDLNNDGVVDDTDQTIIGSPIPDFTYGFNASMNYKNFDFSMAWQGVQGNEIFAKVFQQAGDFTKIDNKFTQLYDNAWRGEGTSNTVPRIGPNNANANYRNSDYYVQDGSFLRLRSLQIGYAFPDSILEPLNMSKLRVFVGGQNLITFDNYDFGLDPEVGNTFGDNLQNGVDFGRYPIPRIITIGVNVGF